MTITNPNAVVDSSFGFGPDTLDTLGIEYDAGLRRNVTSHFHLRT